MNKLQTKEERPVKPWAVTGTFHGAIVLAASEGEARRIFHRCYNGESILDCNNRGRLSWADIL